jgi:hypothetical protein
VVRLSAVAKSFVWMSLASVFMMAVPAAASASASVSVAVSANPATVGAPGYAPSEHIFLHARRKWSHKGTVTRGGVEVLHAASGPK